MSKITAYTALTSAQSDDLLVVVDVHDTSMAPTGTDKNITLANAVKATLDGTTGDIAASPGTAAAGAVGKPADAAHVHPQPSNFAPTGLTGAVQASRYAGATTSGHPTTGTYAVGDFTVDQTGSFWICTAAGTPGTWIQVVAGSVASGGLDSNAAHFQPDGVAAAGGNGLPADSGHVHPEKAWDSLLIAPSGALAETFPRWLASSPVTPSSGTTYVTAISLPKGIVVGNITLASHTAGSSSTTHSWFALLDSTGLVLAVSADGGTANIGGGAYVTKAMTSPYTVTAAGLFYIAQSVTASSMCNWCGAGPLSSIAQRTPTLCGTATNSAAPPTVGTTLTITSSTANNYGYVS